MTTLVQVNTPAKALHPAWGLLLGVIAATFAAPFIKLTIQAGIPSPLIAAGRLLLAAIILTPLVWTKYRAEILSLSRREIFLALMAGFWVGLHFIFMITALEYTSVMLNQVIINTSPIWSALIETLFMKVKLSRTMWIGLFVAVSGGIFIALTSGQEAAASSNAMLGNFLALLGAICGTVYMVFGSKVREKVSLIPYSWIAFGMGGLIALVYALIMGYSVFGYEPDAYFWLLMLTLIPQLMGHSGFNYALGFMNATFISLIAQIVTVTASIVAFFIFAELPSIFETIGGVIIILGVILAIKAPKTKPVNLTSELQA